MDQPLTYVVVQRRPFGESTFSQCCADVFDHDTLTVSCTDAEHDARFGPMQVFQPGTWESATCYDSDAHPLYTFLGVTPKEKPREEISDPASA
jgi:hypothetical protein